MILKRSVKLTAKKLKVINSGIEKAAFNPQRFSQTKESKELWPKRCVAVTELLTEYFTSESQPQEVLGISSEATANFWQTLQVLAATVNDLMDAQGLFQGNQEGGVLRIGDFYSYN